MKNRVSDVRNHLVAMLELLGDDTRSTDEMAQAIERAKATASIAGTYIAAVRVEIDAIRVLDETGRLPAAVAELRAIVEAIEQRQPDLAQQLCQQHVRTAALAALRHLPEQEPG